MGRKVLSLRNKPIVIIVDGVDCSGKSFAAQLLYKEYPGILIKLTFRPRSGNKDEVKGYKNHAYSILEYINTNRKSQIIILDRFFTSELAYSKVKRGYEAFDDKEYPRMEKVLTAMPHLYIYCNPSKKVILDRLEKRGDDYIVAKDVKELVDRYDRVFRQTKMNKLNLDTSKPAEELLRIIKEKLEH